MNTRQAQMWADDLPRPVRRYWQAVARWYASGTSQEPTLDELAKKFEPQVGPRTISRYRHDNHDLVGRWPPKRGDIPEWAVPQPPNGPSPEPEAEVFNVMPGEIHTLRHVRTPGIDDEGRPVLVTLSYDTVTGELVRSWVELHHLVAAGIAGLAWLVDVVSDGRYNHLVQIASLWCRDWLT